MGRNIRDADIIRFIDELPGGSVPQYARLLATSTSRINKLLGAKTGKRLRKKVCVAPLGMKPKWANETTARGELNAENITTLPKFVNELFAAMHPKYRDDGFLLFKTVLEMASGRKGFEQGMTDLVDTYSEIGHHVVALEGTIADGRRALDLLREEREFWQKTTRDIATETGYRLPPLMTRELKLSDLRTETVDAG